jgi:hypothetical protein
MTCSLSWYRRDDNGRREQVEFKLVRDKPEWKLKRERFEPRETFEPAEADWEALIEQMERNLQRGKIYPEDLDIVRKLHERSRH